MCIGLLPGFWNWPPHRHLTVATIYQDFPWHHLSHFFEPVCCFCQKSLGNINKHIALKPLICFTALTCYVSSEECRMDLCVKSGRYKSTSRLWHVSWGQQMWEYVMSPEQRSYSRGRWSSLCCGRRAAVQEAEQSARKETSLITMDDDTKRWQCPTTATKTLHFYRRFPN